MDFEYLFEVLQTGITLDFIFNLGLIIVSIILILYIKQKASDFVSWRQFKSNTGLSIGSVIRLFERGAIIEGRVIRADMRRIILETKDMYVMIPMHEFRNKEWFIKKVYTDNEMPEECKQCPIHNEDDIIEVGPYGDTKHL